MQPISCRSQQQINEDTMFDVLAEVEKDLKAWCDGRYVWRGKNRALLTDLKTFLTESIEAGIVVESHLIHKRHLCAILAR